MYGGQGVQGVICQPEGGLSAAVALIREVKRLKEDALGRERVLKSSVVKERNLEKKRKKKRKAGGNKDLKAFALVT